MSNKLGDFGGPDCEVCHGRFPGNPGYYLGPACKCHQEKNEYNSFGNRTKELPTFTDPGGHCTRYPRIGCFECSGLGNCLVGFHQRQNSWATRWIATLKEELEATEREHVKAREMSPRRPMGSQRFMGENLNELYIESLYEREAELRQWIEKLQSLVVRTQ